MIAAATGSCHLHGLRCGSLHGRGMWPATWSLLGAANAALPLSDPICCSSCCVRMMRARECCCFAEVQAQALPTSLLQGCCCCCFNAKPSARNIQTELPAVAYAKLGCYSSWSALAVAHGYLRCLFSSAPVTTASSVALLSLVPTGGEAA